MDMCISQIMQPVYQKDEYNHSMCVHIAKSTYSTVWYMYMYTCSFNSQWIYGILLVIQYCMYDSHKVSWAEAERQHVKSGGARHSGYSHSF